MSKAVICDLMIARDWTAVFTELTIHGGAGGQIPQIPYAF